MVVVRSILVALVITGCGSSNPLRKILERQNSDEDNANSLAGLPVSSLLEKISGNRVWLSYYYAKRRDGFERPETAVVKKWRVTKSAEQVTGLEEVTASTVIMDASDIDNAALTGSNTKLASTDPLDLNDFDVQYHGRMIVGTAQLRSTDTPRLLTDEVHEIDDSQVFISSYEPTAQTFVEVRFAPAAPDDVVKESTDDSSGTLGVWRAPFGPFKDALVEMSSPAKVRLAEDGPYLRHNLSGNKEYAFTKRFPAKFRQAASRAVAQWNQALGKSFYQPASVDVDQVSIVSECLMRNKLCIDWEGPEDLPWFRPGGLASLAFDPQSGEISGGMVRIVNTADGGPLSDDTKGFDQNHDFTLSEIVSMYIDKDSFLKIRNPNQEANITHVLLHELGHYHGMRHNFVASAGMPLKSPTRSVMDYLAHPIRQNVTSLGSWDIGVIRALYFSERTPADYQVCSDFDVWPRVIDLKLHKNANCQYFDAGDPASFYLEVARQDPQGVFGPGLQKVLLSLYGDLIAHGRGKSDSGNVLATLGYFLQDGSTTTDTQKQEVTAFLCGLTADRRKISKQLVDEQGVNLTCP